jgi:hypothetical protein
MSEIEPAAPPPPRPGIRQRLGTLAGTLRSKASLPPFTRVVAAALIAVFLLVSGAFYTLVPIRPRRRGERRSLRTFAVVSLRPGSLAFNPRPRRLSTPLLTPLNSTPTFACTEWPSADPLWVDRLALVPSKTLPGAPWNPFTASWTETSAPAFATFTLLAVALGRVVEPHLGAREHAKLHLVVTLVVGVLASFAALVRSTRDVGAMHRRLCGHQGLVAASLVAVKQKMPDAPVAVKGLRRLTCNQLPFLFLLATLAGGAVVGDVLGRFGFSLFGWYAAWLYLRFYQPSRDGGGGGARGDGSDAFAFATFFPAPARQFVQPLAVRQTATAPRTRAPYVRASIVRPVFASGLLFFRARAVNLTF